MNQGSKNMQRTANTTTTLASDATHFPKKKARAINPSVTSDDSLSHSHKLAATNPLRAKAMMMHPNPKMLSMPFMSPDMIDLNTLSTDIIPEIVLVFLKKREEQKEKKNARGFRRVVGGLR